MPFLLGDRSDRQLLFPTRIRTYPCVPPRFGEVVSPCVDSISPSGVRRGALLNYGFRVPKLFRPASVLRTRSSSGHDRYPLQWALPWAVLFPSSAQMVNGSEPTYGFFLLRAHPDYPCLNGRWTTFFLSGTEHADASIRAPVFPRCLRQSVRAIPSPARPTKRVFRCATAKPFHSKRRSLFLRGGEPVQSPVYEHAHAFPLSGSPGNFSRA